jgi:hypothetical protein
MLELRDSPASKRDGGEEEVDKSPFAGNEATGSYSVSDRDYSLSTEILVSSKREAFRASKATTG